MKKRRNKFFDIRVQFFFICMAGFIGVALLAALAVFLESRLTPRYL